MMRKTVGARTSQTRNATSSKKKRAAPRKSSGELRGRRDEQPVVREDDGEVDVWPTTQVVEEESRASPVEESGLSVDPEDLGRHWLNQATEQNNFESTDNDEADAGMHVVELPGAEEPEEALSAPPAGRGSKKAGGREG